MSENITLERVPHNRVSRHTFLYLTQPELIQGVTKIIEYTRCIRTVSVIYTEVNPTCRMCLGNGWYYVANHICPGLITRWPIPCVTDLCRIGTFVETTCTHTVEVRAGSKHGGLIRVVGAGDEHPFNNVVTDILIHLCELPM